MRRLSLKGRIVRGFVLVLLLLALLWAAAGYPLFFREWELRRAERSYLLPPGEVLTNWYHNLRYTYPAFTIVDGGDFLEVYKTSRTGNSINQLVKRDETARQLLLYRRAGPVTALSEPDLSLHLDIDALFIFCQIPEAEALELVYTFGNRTVTRTAAYVTEGLFRVDASNNDPWRQDPAPELFARLFDADGNLLGLYELPIAKPLTFYY